MIAAVAARLAGSPRGRLGLVLAAAAAAALLAVAPGPLALAASRAAVAVAVIAAVAVVLSVRPRRAAAPLLAVVARAPLSSGAGLALVEAGGRRLLVGFARDGVSLVAELPAPGETRP